MSQAVTPAHSLHQRILEDIRARIVSGAWAPGFRIPFEHELTAQYACSRMTVNKALSQLAKEGLIERRRRSGSFVARPRTQAAVLDIHDIKTEVEGLGLPYSYKIAARHRRRASREDRDRLGLDDTAPILHLTCRHFAGARPFCLEDRLINLGAVPDAEHEPFRTLAPGPWLIDRVPWSAAEHTISATGANDDTARMLDADPGCPCLVIERRTWSADHSITHVRLTYAGDSHRLVARFAPPTE